MVSRGGLVVSWIGTLLLLLLDFCASAFNQKFTRVIGSRPAVHRTRGGELQEEGARRVVFLSW